MKTLELCLKCRHAKWQDHLCPYCERMSRPQKIKSKPILERSLTEKELYAKFLYDSYGYRTTNILAIKTGLTIKRTTELKREWKNNL